MESICDNRSVGVVISNSEGELALLKRGRFPIGIAPPAGHIDDHGSAEQAAVEEVLEEIGITITIDNLAQTAIYDRRVNNVCRRIGGDHHIWDIYTAQSSEQLLSPNPDETNGAEWYDVGALQLLADRTRAYHRKEVGELDWQNDPGLEEVWLDFFVELGYIR